MSERTLIPRKTFVWGYLGISLLAIFSLIAFGSNAMAIDAVDLVMTCAGQHDTIWPEIPTTFDICIENDTELIGIELGFQLWSPDGATWQWDAQPGGYGAITACVTLVPYSRMDPNGDGSANEVFDLTGLMVTENNVDETGRDSIGTSGISLFSTLATGPLEHMLSLHIIPGVPVGSPNLTLCMDSCFLPPGGDFVFVGPVGVPFPPTTLWPSGGRCWPVKKWMPANGDVNCDGEINVGDVVYLINHIFRGGPPPC